MSPVAAGSDSQEALEGFTMESEGAPLDCEKSETAEVAVDDSFDARKLERLRREKNRLTARIGELISRGEDASDLIARAGELKAEIQCIEDAQQAVTETEGSDTDETDAEPMRRPTSMRGTSAATSARSLKPAIIDSADWSEWDERLLAHDGSVFHSSKWAEFRLACGDDACFRVGLMDGERLVRPLAMATLRSARLSRSIGVRGAIEATNPGELGAAVELLRTIAQQERCATLSIEGRDFLLQQSDLSQFGFAPSYTNEILVNCDRSADELWLAIHNRSRQSIRRARRKGITATEQSSATGAALAAELDTTLREAKCLQGDRFAQVGRAQYQAIWDALGPSGNVRFFVARLDGSAVGSLMLLTWGARTCAWRAGYTLEARQLGVSAPLYWSALRFTCQNAFNTLNLGPLPPGAEDPNSEHHGLFRFKTRWDGHPVPRQSGTIVMRPLLHRVTRTVHALRSR